MLLGHLASQRRELITWAENRPPEAVCYVQSVDGGTPSAPWGRWGFCRVEGRTGSGGAWESALAEQRLWPVPSTPSVEAGDLAPHPGCPLFLCLSLAWESDI